MGTASRFQVDVLRTVTQVANTSSYFPSIKAANLSAMRLTREGPIS